MLHGIFTYIYLKIGPNIGIYYTYSIDGASGYGTSKEQMGRPTLSNASSANSQVTERKSHVGVDCLTALQPKRHGKGEPKMP